MVKWRHKLHEVDLVCYHLHLHITCLMLPTKNCTRAFDFVKVIIRNTVSFFPLQIQ